MRGIMPRKRTRNRTPKKDWGVKFLETLARTGNIFHSAKKARIARSAPYLRKNSDPLFAQLWDEALAISVEMLELEARRRAEKGTRKPMLYKGRVVKYVMEYSDTLMIFLLKAHAPGKYRDVVKHEQSGSLDVTSGGKPIGQPSLTADDLANSASLAGMAVERIHKNGRP